MLKTGYYGKKLFTSFSGKFCNKYFSEEVKKIAVFSSKGYDKTYLNKHKTHNLEFTFFESRLEPKTAKLAEDHHAVCAFVNDDLSSETLEILKEEYSIDKIAMRCAGYNNIDLEKAKKLSYRIARVVEYSPHAVAEHAVTLIMALNRRVKQSIDRVRDANFELDGLLGFDIHGKTVGVIGTGKIGTCFANIMKGFGANLLLYDEYQNPQLKDDPHCKYVSMDELFKNSDIISIHSNLNPGTFHLIDKKSIEKMKPGVMIINVSRGPIINTKDVIEGLKSKKVGYLGLDVVEQEEEVFFKDLSSDMISNDDIARLMMFNNVIITGHQAFFTQEALTNISRHTIENLNNMFKGLPSKNYVI
jgi:D-lactate dehydrogenase